MPQDLSACPFCGKAHTLKLTSAEELAREGDDFDDAIWPHSDSWAVMCDASRPDGPGGCGASGGFFPTEAEAVQAWNRRTALEAQAAEIARLTAERDAFKQSLYAELDTNLRLRELGGARDDESMTPFLERVIAERDGLRVDAERYRYLRNRVPAEVFDARGFKAGVWIDCEDDAGQLTLLTGDDADRDIDAAREST